MKRDKLDIAFSFLIRERNDWHCEFSGRYFPESERGELECAHIYGRTVRSVRCDSRNAVALNTGQHFYFTEHPMEFRDWLHDYLGPAHMRTLQLLANRSVTYAKMREELYVHLKKERERLRILRLGGECGYIEAAPFDCSEWYIDKDLPQREIVA